MTSLEASFFSTLSTTRFYSLSRGYISKNFSYFKIFDRASFIRGIEGDGYDPCSRVTRVVSLPRSNNIKKRICSRERELSLVLYLKELSNENLKRLLLRSKKIRMMVSMKGRRGWWGGGERERERENNRGRGMKWRVEKEREKKEPRCLSEQNILVKPLNDP